MLFVGSRQAFFVSRKFYSKSQKVQSAAVEFEDEFEFSLTLTLTLTLTTDYYLPNAFRLGLRETQLPSLRPYQSRQRKLQIGQGAASR
jgi:hypothetical protein